MLINLSDVLSEQHKPIDVMVDFEMDEFQKKYDTFPIIKKMPVHVSVSHIRAKELRIQAETGFTAVIPCDRCLTDVEYEMPLEFTKVVDLAVADAELKEGFDESNFINGYHLDVDKMLYNEILL